MVRPSPDNKYNLLVNHLHFHEKGVKDVMPQNTKFIAIVRHPVDLFESIMSYYTDDVRAFQRIPGKINKLNRNQLIKKRLLFYSLCNIIF